MSDRARRARLDAFAHEHAGHTPPGVMLVAVLRAAGRSLPSRLVRVAVATSLPDAAPREWGRDINHALNLIRRSLAPVVVGNTDLLYPVKDGGVALAVGSLANMLQPIAQKSFYRFGKPDAMMFVYALQAMRSARPGTKNHRVLMVGDTLQTDILGARMAGLDTVLVLSGNTMPHQAEMLIQSTGIVPTYVCPDILT